MGSVVDQTLSWVMFLQMRFTFLEVGEYTFGDIKNNVENIENWNISALFSKVYSTS